MTNDEIYTVRLALSDARSTSLSRQYDRTSEYAELWREMAEFWKSKAPEGTELPPEILEHIEEWKARNLP